MGAKGEALAKQFEAKAQEDDGPAKVDGALVPRRVRQRPRGQGAFGGQPVPRGDPEEPVARVLAIFGLVDLGAVLRPRGRERRIERRPGDDEVGDDHGHGIDRQPVDHPEKRGGWPGSA